MELPLLAVPVYHSSILKKVFHYHNASIKFCVQDKNAIAQKISQNIIRAWHKVQQGNFYLLIAFDALNNASLVTKDLSSPVTTADPPAVDTTTPWLQYNQVLSM